MHLLEQAYVYCYLIRSGSHTLQESEIHILVVAVVADWLLYYRLKIVLVLVLVHLFSV